MGVSTTHRINLSMWIFYILFYIIKIYSFSDTYYVWAACEKPKFIWSCTAHIPPLMFYVIQLISLPFRAQNLIPNAERRNKLRLALTFRRANGTFKTSCDHKVWLLSRRLYWCSKTMKRRPYCCFKQILWEFDSFLM